MCECYSSGTAGCCVYQQIPDTSSCVVVAKCHQHNPLTHASQPASQPVRLTEVKLIEMKRIPAWLDLFYLHFIVVTKFPYNVFAKVKKVRLFSTEKSLQNLSKELPSAIDLISYVLCLRRQAINIVRHYVYIFPLQLKGDMFQNLSSVTTESLRSKCFRSEDACNYHWVESSNNCHPLRPVNQTIRV